jgi:hypothetical protein
MHCAVYIVLPASSLCSAAHLQGPAASPVLIAASDSDFAGCTDTGRSSAVALFKDSPILWRSAKLGSIVKNANAAEYVAASLASDEVMLFLRSLLSEFGYKLPPTPFFVDNSAAVGILKSGKVDGKIKHLAVHWHCVPERQFECVKKLMLLGF